MKTVTKLFYSFLILVVASFLFALVKDIPFAKVLLIGGFVFSIFRLWGKQPPFIVSSDNTSPQVNPYKVDVNTPVNRKMSGFEVALLWVVVLFAISILGLIIYTSIIYNPIPDSQ